MKNLLKEYLKTNICADEIQEYTIIGDSANALSIIQSAAKEYKKFYNQIEFSIFKNETNDTYMEVKKIGAPKLVHILLLAISVLM